MMDRHRDAIKALAAQQGQAAAMIRYGTVASVDPVLDRIKATLQPEGTVTSWLPVMRDSATAGAGSRTVPTPGEQVLLFGEGGSNNSLVALGFVHSSADQPAAPANTIGTGGVPSAASVPGVSGEVLIVSTAGSVVRLCADGSIYVRGSLHVDGSLVVNGDVSDRHGTLDALREAYNSHVHGSSPTTSIPVPE